MTDTDEKALTDGAFWTNVEEALHDLNPWGIGPRAHAARVAVRAASKYLADKDPEYAALLWEGANQIEAHMERCAGEVMALLGANRGSPFGYRT